MTVGATLEHVGFDEAVHEEQVSRLDRGGAAAAARGDDSFADRCVDWIATGYAGWTADPGCCAAANCWHATGHYRDGILLAPVTARVMAQAMLGETPDVSLAAFSPARFKSS